MIGYNGLVRQHLKTNCKILSDVVETIKHIVSSVTLQKNAPYLFNMVELLIGIKNMALYPNNACAKVLITAYIADQC